MKKIWVNEFDGSTRFNVFVTNEKGETVNKKKNLNQELAENWVYNFIESYYFQDDDLIIATWFDDEDNEKWRTDRTVQQWKEEF